jgi:O-antigen/teichoic acid export membrane protein
MNREFFVNIIFLIVINVIIKPIYIFGIDRNVQNLVGEQAYGIYFTLTSFCIMLYIISDLGIQNFNSREIAQHRHLLDKYFSNILVLKMILSVVYLLVIFAVTYILHYDFALYPLVFSIALNQLLFQWLIYLRTNIAGLGYYKTNSILTVLDRILLISLCSVLIWVEPFRSQFTIEWFIHAQNTTIFITCVVAFFLVFKHIKRFKLRINVPFLLLILRGSLPYALSVFLMGVYTRTDVVMIERLLPDGDKEAGIYASAYRLLDAVSIIGFLFSTLLMPMFSRLIKEKQAVAPLLRLSFQLVWAGAMTLAIGTWFHRASIMQLLYAHATPYSGDVLGVLILSFISFTGIYIYNTLLGAKGNLKKMNILYICAIGVNIALNFILIPSQKALGAAISTLVTQSFVLLVLMFICQKIFELKTDWLWIAKLGGFVGAVVATNFIVKSYLFPDSWLWQFIVGLGICFILSLLFGFFNYKKMAVLLKGT